MQSKIPKNTNQYYWTEHVKFKMRQYALSAQKILGVIKRPQRKEEGIVKNTVAVMSPVSPKIINGKMVWKQEIWVMYQKNKKINLTPPPAGGLSFVRRGDNKQVKIISAWRYPGVSSEKNPIPEEILREIGDMAD